MQTDAAERKFGPFRLDLRRHRLMRDGKEIYLRRKVWDLLAHMAARPGDVVSSRDLIDVLWPDVAVTPNALTRTVSELRQALGGKAASDRYLRTVPKRGLLFLPEEIDSAEHETATIEEPTSSPESKSLIGREQELVSLRQAWQLASSGARQVVFLHGVPGVGKTTLADVLCDEIRNQRAMSFFARGQSLPQGGKNDPLVPIIEAVEQLAEQIGEAAFLDLARRYAPTWLVQMPWLVNIEEIGHLRRSLAVSGPTRTLHEAVRLLEHLSKSAPLLLVLDDLHWADRNSIDLLVALAERSKPARLMVIAIYRSVEAALTDHPIARAAQSMCSRRKGVAIEIGAWGLPQTQAYLRRRFGSAVVTKTFAEPVLASSHGTPLLALAMIDHLLQAGQVWEEDGAWTCDADVAPERIRLPADLSGLVESWLARQPDPLINALEAASLIDGDFTIQEVAAALGCSETEMDEAFSEIERRGPLIELVGTGRWPDSTTTVAYRFTHALYRQALSDRVAPLRRMALHRGIGERLESAYLSDPGPLASRLAAHFDGAGDTSKHVAYLEVAAATALQRFAYGDAAAHLRRALTGIARLPMSPARARREAARWIDYGGVVQVADGLGSSTALDALQKGLALASEVGESHLHFRALMGLCFGFGFGGRLDRALPIHQSMLEVARVHDARLLPIAHLCLAMTETSLGRLESAWERIHAAMEMEAATDVLPAWSVAVGLRVQAAVCGALLGRGNCADEVAKTVTLAETTGLPTDLMIATAFGAAIHAWSREWAAARLLAKRAVAIADERASTTYQCFARIVLARVEAEDAPENAIQELEAQLAARATLGERWWNSCFLGWLAEGNLRAGNLELALSKTDDALNQQERVFRGETLRIRAAIFAALGRIEDAQACLHDKRRNES